MKTGFDSHFTKRISFVLTTKNRASYLEKALEDTKKLTGPNDELIIIDGNSTDGTKDIIEKHLDSVDTFISENDEGQGHAYNKGLLLSSGKYICYLTDDDVFYREAVEQAAGIMDNNPDIDVLIPGGMKEKNGKEKYVYMPEGSDFGKNVESLYMNSWCGLGFFIRASSIAKAGLSDPNCVAHDNSYIAQCISRGLNVKFARINMYYHRIYDHSGTVARFKVWEKDYLGIIKKYCSRTFYIRYLFMEYEMKIKRKYKWLLHFDLIGLFYRSIKLLLTKGPISFLRKAKKRIFEQNEFNKVTDKSSDVIWDGSIN